MPNPIPRRPLAVVAILAVTAALAALVLAQAGWPADSPVHHASGAGTLKRPETSTATVAVDPTGPATAVPAGFLGLSLEYSALPAYAGRDPQAPDPLFTRLLDNLAPGQDPVVRIGGDSTDHTWWPVTGIRRPPGVRFSLTARWAAVARAFAAAANAKLIFGINLEADDRRLVTTEVHQLQERIGTGSIAAFELGNEPELYRSLGWYKATNGRQVPGRRRTYTPAVYSREFARFAGYLPSDVAIAGPAIGGRQWIRSVPAFVAAQRRLAMVTIHRYPLQQCGLPAASPLYPSIRNLLSGASTTGLASGVEPYADAAHARGLALRVDEFNTVSCGGRDGVSNSFASALWALQTLFALRRAGVDGVNVHTFPGASYQPFVITYSHGAWTVLAEPEYYGLLMFARAVPRGSRLLAASGHSSAGLSTWATLGVDGRVRVVAINTNLTSPGVVTIRSRVAGTATVTRLQAPSAYATAGVTLGGQAVGARTGVLEGPRRSERVRPRGGAYEVKLPAASAALVTLPAGGA